MVTFNKEIQKLKIALTPKCTLRCTHCHIDHTINQILDERYIYKAIDFFLSTPGKFKRLELYGGEPLLCVEFLKKIVRYTKEKTKIKNKRISISIATNLTILNQEIIDFLKDNEINISISFYGSKNSHNYNRIFQNGMGSYDIVLNNVKKIIRYINSDYLVCLYCIDKKFAPNIYSDFKKIINYGFKIINIEIVHGCNWTLKDYGILKRELNKVCKHIYSNIASKEKIILESFIDFVRDKCDSLNLLCPFYKDLELYPDGYFGFFPYAFFDYSKYKDDVVISKIPLSIDKKYYNCKFNSNCLENCIDNYYSVFPQLNDGSIGYSIRSEYIKELFKKILLSSSKNKIYREYIKECYRIFNLTYI